MKNFIIWAGNSKVQLSVLALLVLSIPLALYMSRQQQTLRQHAAGTGASIAALPANGQHNPGDMFTVDIHVDGGGTTFNAIQSDIAVSSNLTITGLEGPNLYSGATPPVGSGYINNSTDPKYCYFTYLSGNTTDFHPKLTNPSFAAFGSYIPSCTIYTLHLQVASGATGAGTITFTNMQVAGNNTTIALTPQNGNYTLDTVSTTPTPTGSAKIQINPASNASLHVGDTFTMSVLVDGQGTAFNAAQATINLSSSTLSVVPGSFQAGTCGFIYVAPVPSATYLSFAGAIPTTSATSCTAYQVQLQATAIGTGTVTITNPSVVDFATNSPMRTSVQDGSYSIDIVSTVTPTPTDIPTVAPTSTPTITPSPTTVPTVVPTHPLDSIKFSFVNLFLDGVGAAGDNTHPLPSLTSIPTQTISNPTRVLTVELFANQTDSTPILQFNGDIAYQQTRGNFMGNVFWDNPSSGTYYMKVITPGYLRRAIPNAQSLTLGETLELPTSRLIAGDVDGDNRLTIADYNIMLDCGDFGFTPLPISDPHSQFHVSATCAADQTNIMNNPATNGSQPGLLAGNIANADADNSGVIDTNDQTLLQRELAVQGGD